MRKLNKASIELIQRFEGLRLTAYKDVVGIWTIGWGHTGPDVTPGLKITRERALELLEKDLEEAIHAVETLAAGVKLTDNQFGALVSLTFNIGIGAFTRSTLLWKLKSGQYAEVPAEIKRWNRAGGKVVSGLVKRRQAEANLFQTEETNGQVSA